MGSYMSYYKNVVDEGSISRGLKRSSDGAEDEKALAEEVDMHTPKRKKMKTTDYIYQALFVNGDSSDVSIVALGKEWRLHKVYLCQCGYFMSMFRGSWKESTLSVVKMTIPDKNIDQEALDVAFGSLYRDDILVKPAQVVGVLAAASLLRLDGLEQQAAEIMMETVCASTVCSYVTAARLYGQADVARKCMVWLETNLMIISNATLLRSIGSDLMEQLILSNNLVVMQVEMDIYSMLKRWLFLQLTPAWQGSRKQLAADADSYYKAWSMQQAETSCSEALSGSDCPDGNGTEAFLTTSDGESYSQVFRALRFQHIINDTACVKVVLTDKLVPEDWLLPYFKRQWLHMLQIEQGKDKGPQDISAETFDQEAFRCGRVLAKDGEYCWRWTGFHYGIDFLVTYSNKLIVFKRSTTNQSCPNSVSLQAKRSFLYRLSVFSLDDLRNMRHSKHTGFKSLTLGKDEEFVALCLDRNITFPLHISLSLLNYTPDPEWSLKPLSRPLMGPTASPSLAAGRRRFDDNGGHAADLGRGDSPRSRREGPSSSQRNDSAVALQEQNVVPVELEDP